MKTASKNMKRGFVAVFILGVLIFSTISSVYAQSRPNLVGPPIGSIINYITPGGYCNANPNTPLCACKVAGDVSLACCTAGGIMCSENEKKAIEDKKKQQEEEAKKAAEAGGQTPPATGAPADGIPGLGAEGDIKFADSCPAGSEGKCICNSQRNIDCVCGQSSSGDACKNLQKDSLKKTYNIPAAFANNLACGMSKDPDSCDAAAKIKSCRGLDIKSTGFQASYEDCKNNVPDLVKERGSLSGSAKGALSTLGGEAGKLFGLGNTGSPGELEDCNTCLARVGLCGCSSICTLTLEEKKACNLPEVVDTEVPPVEGKVITGNRVLTLTGTVKNGPQEGQTITQPLTSLQCSKVGVAGGKCEGTYAPFEDCPMFMHVTWTLGGSAKITCEPQNPGKNIGQCEIRTGSAGEKCEGTGTATATGVEGTTLTIGRICTASDYDLDGTTPLVGCSVDPFFPAGMIHKWTID